VPQRISAVFFGMEAEKAMLSIPSTNHLALERKDRLGEIRIPR